MNITDAQNAQLDTVVDEAQTNPTPIQAESKEVTAREWRKMMGLYFTSRLKRVSECGHRFNEYREPRTNCEWCWFSYFNMHSDLVKTAHECYMDEGRNILERIQGKRFVKMWLRFMSTVAKFVAEQKGNDGSGVTETSGKCGSVQKVIGSGGVVEQTVQDNSQPSKIGG